MKVTKKNLAKLDSEYKGYLEGDVLDQFFEDFEINFSAGHWCGGEFFDRFASFGYNSNNPEFKDSIVDQIERVSLAHVKGIEFHESVFIDRKYKKDPAKIAEVKQALERFHVIPTNMNINTWTDPKWKFGGICNPDLKIRKDAIALCLQGAEIAKEVGCKSLQLWPGSDGWDYNFEVNYGNCLDWFIEGCITINNKAKELGLIFGTEAKMKEPREGNMIVPTTAQAALIAKTVNEACGGNNMGVTIDYGHEQMSGIEPAMNLYLLKRMGLRVTNFHINSAKYRSNDEDRVTGTDDVWRLADFCYAAIDTGYDGWFGEDQFTYRMEQVKAISLSREIFGNIMKKALQIYAVKEKLQAAQATGDAGNTIDVVKKILI